ncbi:hypothetical protein OROGR_009281 [Orobanche gracilis]
MGWSDGIHHGISIAMCAGSLDGFFHHALVRRDHHGISML